MCVWACPGRDKKIRLGKPLIDSSSFLSWEYVDEPVISNNGNYVSYKERYIYSKKPVKTIIQNRSGSWKTMFYNIKELIFSDNSDHVLFCWSEDPTKSFVFFSLSFFNNLFLI